MAWIRLQDAFRPGKQVGGTSRLEVKPGHGTGRMGCDTRRLEELMGKVFWLGVGFAVGYVVGTKGGRKAYDDMVAAAQKILDHPTVQEVAGVVQEQANRMVEESRRKLATPEAPMS